MGDREIYAPRQTASTSDDASAKLAERVRGHMPELDGWRGLAIATVVLHNAGSVLGDSSSFLTTITRTALSAGWIGVSMFFVLSGFLITGILLDTSDSPHFLRNFYVRRTLRIFPLYYTTVALVFVGGPLLVARGPWTDSISQNQLWYWAYLSNWTPLWNGGIEGLSHFWSLGVEEQFYLVWPVLLLATGRRRFGLAAVAIVLAAPAVRLAMHLTHLPPSAIYQVTPARADALAAGALLALLARQPERMAVLRRRRGALLAWSVAALTGVVLWTRGLEPHEPGVLVLGQSFVVAVLTILMLVSLDPADAPQRGLARWLALRPLGTLGKYSYAMYVFHFPLHLLLADAVSPLVNAGGPLSRSVLTVSYGLALLLASLLVAIGSWHLLESRFLALKDRLAPRSVA